MNNFKINNLIIHDSARPYVTENYYTELLKSCDHYEYSQYYLKLVNGLARKEGNQYNIYGRDDFIELCTPVCCKFNLYYFIFMNYLCNNIPYSYELIPILNLMKIECKFIEGKYKYLKKITYFEDI